MKDLMFTRDRDWMLKWRKIRKNLSKNKVYFGMSQQNFKLSVSLRQQRRWHSQLFQTMTATTWLTTTTILLTMKAPTTVLSSNRLWVWKTKLQLKIRDLANKAASFLNSWIQSCLEIFSVNLLYAGFQAPNKKLELQRSANLLWKDGVPGPR